VKRVRFQLSKKTFHGGQGQRLRGGDARLLVADAADADAQERIAAEDIECAGEAIARVSRSFSAFSGPVE